MSEIAQWPAHPPGLWVGLFLIGLVLGLGFLEIWQTRNPQKAAQHNQNPTGHQPVPVGQQHPTEEEHRTAQHAYWDRHIESQNRRDRIGWVTLAFSGIAALGVILSFQQTRRQADTAKDTLTASSRPWVMLTDIKPASPSSDDEAGVDLWVNISAKNVGHSPAQNVSVSAKLLIDDFDPPPDQAMASVCREAQSGSFIIPGQVLFPDQDQDVDAGIARGFGIEAERVWAARAARIKSTYDAEMASGKAERAQAWASELAKFPFYAPLNFVGCINYRSSDNEALYQTSSMYSVTIVSTNPRRDSFPLLGGKPPIVRYPEPEPGNPDILMVFPRELQRILPGNQVKLGKPLYSTFAN